MEEKKSDFGLSEHVFKIYVKYKAWMKTRTGVIMLSSTEGGILEEKNYHSNSIYEMLCLK